MDELIKKLERIYFDEEELRRENESRTNTVSRV